MKFTWPGQYHCSPYTSLSLLLLLLFLFVFNSIYCLFINKWCIGVANELAHWEKHLVLFSFASLSRMKKARSIMFELATNCRVSFWWCFDFCFLLQIKNKYKYRQRKNWDSKCSKSIMIEKIKSMKQGNNKRTANKKEKKRDWRKVKEVEC